MSIRNRRGIVIATVLATFLLFFLQMQKPQVRTRAAGPNERNNPRQEINLAHVKSFRLTVNDVPFGKERHACYPGDTLTFSSEIDRTSEVEKKYMYPPKIVIVYERAGAPESAWDSAYKKNAWKFYFGRVGKPRQFTGKVEPAKMPPGVYELRAYLAILDMEGEDDICDLIGKAELEVRPQVPVAGNDSGDTRSQ